MKKITMLILLLVNAIVFSQTRDLKTNGISNPINYKQQQNFHQNPISQKGNKAEKISAKFSRAEAPIYSNQYLVKNKKADQYTKILFDPASYKSSENSTTVNYKMPVGAKSFDAFVPSVESQKTFFFPKTPTSFTENQRGPLAVVSYSDRTAFEAAYSGTFVIENFAGGPGAGAIIPCGPVVSSSGDGCFPTGELEDGFSITASSGLDVIYIGAGAIGNTSTLMGANTFADFTIINFAPDGAYAVGHDLFFSNVTTADYRVFDTGGALLQSFTVTLPANTESFFGIISDDAIGRVEIQASADAGELFGNFEFGTTPSGGGGGGPCSQSVTSNAFEDGLGDTTAGVEVADDIRVAADTDFTVEQLTVNIFNNGGFNNVVVGFYENNGGLPGAQIGSFQTVVPTSSTVIGSNFGFDVNEIVLDLSPVMLPGAAGSETVYWVSVETPSPIVGGPAYAETTTVPGSDFPVAVDVSNGGWAVNSFGFQSAIFTVSGQCESTGGGGGPCSQSVASNAFEDGLGDTTAGVEVADDIRVAADTDFTVEQLTVNIFNNGGFNNVVVGFYENSGGLPGAQIGGFQTVVPTSSTVIGSNFGFDVNEIVLDLSPVMLPGTAGSETVYWVSVETPSPIVGGPAYAETTTVPGSDFPVAVDVSNGGWAVNSFGFQSAIFTVSGQCESTGGGVTCISTTYDSTSVPFDIDGAGNVTADCVNAPNLIPVTVGDSGTIGGDANIENVTIDLTHTFDGDLIISLVSPNGTELVLSNRNGGSGDNYTNTIFMDGGADITAGAPPYTGTFAPEGGSFAAAFDGEAITGDWNLKICDAAGGDTGQVLAFSMSICIPPDNDTCEFAKEFACGDTVTGDTSNNTNQGGFNTSPDEWFKYTGTGDVEVVTLSLCGGATFDTVLTVYDSCGGAIITNNDDFCGLQSQLSFLSDGTSTYYVAVEGFGASTGPFSMDVICATPPANDLCSNAIAVSCGDSVSGTTINASEDSGVAPECGTTVNSPGVWYSLADNSGLAGNITLSLCTGTAYDSKISVYTGDCGAPPLTCVAGNDDSCGLQSEVTFPTNGNTTFLVLVHGFNGATGDFVLDVSCLPTPPPNDMIANSIDVDEIGFPYTDPSVAMPAATTENGNPSGCDLTGANGVWYNFVPEGDGTAIASITTPGGASSVTFYTAPDESSVETDLVLVPQNTNQCVPGTSSSINTVAGQAYYVFVLNTGSITDIVIDGTNLGTSENSIVGFSFYPNPSTNTINLKAADTIDYVSIYNLLGQRVIDTRVEATTSQVDVSALSVGTYIMKVSVNGQIGTYKVLKK